MISLTSFKKFSIRWGDVSAMPRPYSRPCSTLGTFTPGNAALL
jgi:hypothetical protein